MRWSISLMSIDWTGLVCFLGVVYLIDAHKIMRAINRVGTLSLTQPKMYSSSFTASPPPVLKIKPHPTQGTKVIRSPLQPWVQQPLSPSEPPVQDHTFLLAIGKFVAPSSSLKEPLLLALPNPPNAFLNWSFSGFIQLSAEWFISFSAYAGLSSWHWTVKSKWW